MRPSSACAVLVPVAASLEPETEAALRVLADRGHPVRMLKGCSQVDLARSALASAALDDGFAETLWVDSDITFDPDDVQKLRTHDRPLVAGLYVKRGKPELAGKFLAAGRVRFGAGGGLVEMRYLGMGFTLVRRQVYEAVAAHAGLPRCGGGYDPARKIVPYFIPSLAPDGEGGWCYLSEDYSFCHRARQAGFPAWADTTVRLGHGVGPHKYSWDDLYPRPPLDRLEVEVALAPAQRP